MKLAARFQMLADAAFGSWVWHSQWIILLLGVDKHTRQSETAFATMVI